MSLECDLCGNTDPGFFAKVFGEGVNQDDEKESVIIEVVCKKCGAVILNGFELQLNRNLLG